jgi:fimbrial chaperone protein
MTRLKNFLTLFVVLAAGLLAARPARADLTITPWRVVFQDRDRSATVELVNQTNRTNIYRLTWIQLKMNEHGRYEPSPIPKDDKNPHDVNNMVIFTPRQVTIEPHGQQTIRLSLRRPADLPFGEYRAHMALIRLAKQGPERQDPNAKSISMELNVNLGFSIPVIVRSGEDKALKVALDSPQLAMSEEKTNKHPELRVNIDRVAGTFSTYGTIEAYWQAPGAKEEKIGSMDNVALYPEMNKRLIAVPLRENPTSGKMRVVYKGKYESDDKIWDEKVFPIGK